MLHEDFRKRGWQQFVHPDDLPETLKAFHHAIETGTPYEVVHRVRRSGGEFRRHRDRGEPMRDREGRIIQWYGLSIDVDEAKKAEDRLRRSEAYLKEAQRLSHSGVAAYNETTIFFGSEETYRIWGFDPAQGVPSREAVFQRIHPDDRDRLNAEVQRAVSEKRDFDSQVKSRWLGSHHKTNVPNADLRLGFFNTPRYCAARRKSDSVAPMFSLFEGVSYLHTWWLIHRCGIMLTQWHIPFQCFRQSS